MTGDSSAPRGPFVPVARTVRDAPPARMAVSAGAPACKTSAERGPDGLCLQVSLEPVVAVLASYARGLEAAERRRGIGPAPMVYVHRAGAQKRGQAVGIARVARPHPGGEPVLGVVCAARHFLERVIGRGDEHGTEDLLPGDLQIIGGGAEQGRLYEPATALRQCHRAARHELGALLAASVDVGHHAVALLRGDERAELGGGIEARAELGRLGALCE